jgi:hypothetical protein
MNATRLRRVALLGACVMIAACTDGGPTGIDSEMPGPNASLLGLGGLVQCAPLAAVSASAVVGPEGGTVQVGPHSLSIPAGALSGATTITAVAPSGPVNRVAFGPEGLTFAQPATLTLSHANCGGLAGLIPKRIAYLTGELDILELLTSVDNLGARRVSASLDHFSSYAIAW